VISPPLPRACVSRNSSLKALLARRCRMIGPQGEASSQKARPREM
jgi:hypothetical protein